MQYRRKRWLSAVSADTMLGREEYYNPVPRAEAEVEAPVIPLVSVIGTTAPAWYVEPAPLIDPNEPQPAIQYIGMEEYTNLVNEGIIIPPDANVVIVPVNEITNSELFDEIVVLKENNPAISIQDIVSIVVNPTNNPISTNIVNPVNNTDAPIAQAIKDEDRNELLDNVKVILMVQDNPGLTVAEAQYNVSEGNIIPVTYIDPIVQPTTKPQEIIKDIQENQQNKPIITEKQIGQFFDLLDKLFGYESDKNLTNDQVIAKTEDQVYKAGGIATAGILGLIFLT